MAKSEPSKKVVQPKEFSTSVIVDVASYWGTTLGVSKDNQRALLEHLVGRTLPTEELMQTAKIYARSGLVKQFEWAGISPKTVTDVFNDDWSKVSQLFTEMHGPVHRVSYIEGAPLTVMPISLNDLRAMSINAGYHFYSRTAPGRSYAALVNNAGDIMWFEGTGQYLITDPRAEVTYWDTISREQFMEKMFNK